MNPTISVIIPAYNEEKLIGKCIEALLKQTYPKEKYEIIVVDNNSSDKTLEVAKKYDVRAFEYTKMNRVSAVRQFGASHARGNILAFMDADSFADPTWLKTIERLLQNESYKAVCGVALPHKASLPLKLAFEGFNQVTRLNQLFGTVLPWGFNFAIKKSAFDHIGGYNTALKTYDDAEMGLRLKKYYGKQSIYYSQDLKVYTSTRKQEDVGAFVGYMRDTIRNYVNVVILKRANTAEIKNIR